MYVGVKIGGELLGVSGLRIVQSLAITHFLGILSCLLAPLAVGAEACEVKALREIARQVTHAYYPLTLLDDDGVVETLALGDNAVGATCYGFGEAVRSIVDGGVVNADALVELHP